MNSLAGRLLLASVVLLPLFLGTTGYYLDRSHRQGVELAVAQQLQLQIFTLLAEAEYDSMLWLPDELLEARFNLPDSGLYALVTAGDGATLWASPSAQSLAQGSLSRNLPVLEAGSRSFSRGNSLFRLSYQVVWEIETGVAVPLMFTVVESVELADAQLQLYRRGLLIWLGGSALLLIVFQALILFWGLRPLRKLAGDISGLETGASEVLDGTYPREVQAVTESLNTLLLGEKKRRERARNTLSDLAHSLKTPLAVIRSADSKEGSFGELVLEQTRQMEQIVAYQLQRAVGGSHRLLGRVSVSEVVIRLQTSLLKVYADKCVEIETAIHADCVFRGDGRDLMELMGILMDNACKYGRKRVLVTASGGSVGPLLITVEDDGGGIPVPLRKAILKRGTRADSQQSGHGIGLAVAADLAESYLGTLQLSTSSLGGAYLRVELP